MQYVNTMIQLDKLTLGDNPRLPTNLNIAPLADNIEGLGKLLEPITVWQPNGEDVFQVIRGHRRTLAASVIRERNPERFQEIFPEGIPSFVVEGATAEDVVELKLDHTEQQGLSDPHEVQMSANMLFAIRRTQAEVSFQLSSLIDKVSPMKAKNKAELDELKEKLDDAKAQGKPKAIANAEKEVKEYIAEYRRGFVQHLNDVYRAPSVVNAALYYKACHQAPKGFEDTYLPPLTNKQVNTLWKAHKEDLEIKDEDGAPKYNQQRVGPNFSEKWDKICADAKAKEDGSPKPPTAKAMSAKDMKAEITEGRWSSLGFVKLTAWHAGDKAVEGLDDIDNAYHYLDLVKKEQSDLYDMIVQEGQNIEAAQIEADKKAKAEADDEEEAVGTDG